MNRRKFGIHQAQHFFSIQTFAKMQNPLMASKSHKGKNQKNIWNFCRKHMVAFEGLQDLPIAY
jgi:hypothetical protein